MEQGSALGQERRVDIISWDWGQHCGLLRKFLLHSETGRHVRRFGESRVFSIVCYFLRSDVPTVQLIALLKRSCSGTNKGPRHLYVTMCG